MSAHSHAPREGVCIDKMTVSAVTAAVLISLVAAAVLGYLRISDLPQAFLGVAGAGLAGLLALAQGKRGPASQTVNAGPGGSVQMDAPATSEPEQPPAVGNGAGAG